MVFEKILGMGFIIFGVFFLRYTVKNPNKKFFSSDVKGLVGAIGSIILGILLLIGQLHWQ